MHTFYVSDPIHPDALAALSDMGEVNLGYGPDSVQYSDVQDRVDAVLLRAETFSADMITGSPKLKIIARHGVGTDNVDLDAATAHGVWVTTTPGSNSRAVAEHVFALLLSLARKTPTATNGVAAGGWSDLKPQLNGFELGGRTLGLVGFGNIARIVADIARGFGMTIHVSDPFITADAVTAAGATLVSLDDLIDQSDVISLHVPLTDVTASLIDASALQRMRPGAFLINTSRGGLIDESALAVALTDGHLGGAALDVLSGESIDMKNPLPYTALAEQLDHLSNLIITPHVAGQTDKAFETAGHGAVTCIRQALANETPDNVVNAVLAPATGH
ncbi:MAG: hydroxyacid dehydrogenase [Rhodococcus sp. (in: high G+C Gram-positive bacteria)]